MELLGFVIPTLFIALLAVIEAIGLALLAAMAVAVILGGLSVLVFRKTRKVFIPRLTLFVLNLLEGPIKSTIWLFRTDEAFIDQMMVQIRNTIYTDAYKNVPASKRAIFLPQCLRSPNCPAKLTPEGIKCVECGQCGIAEVKKVAESMGYMFFIVPGSSFVKRMVRKYKPEAILGVGCPMEVKEGTSMMASVGLPVQGVMLLKDGCVDTRVNVEDLIQKIRMLGNQPNVDQKEVERIAKGWSESEPKFYVKVKKQD